MIQANKRAGRVVLKCKNGHESNVNHVFECACGWTSNEQ